MQRRISRPGFWEVGGRGVRRFIALLAGMLLSPAMPAAVRADFADNFNAGNDANWTHVDPLAPFTGGGQYSFPSDGSGGFAYRLQSPPSPDPAHLGVARMGAAANGVNLGDFSLSVDLLAWDDKLDQAFGLLARVSNIGLGTTSGYFLHYNNAFHALVLEQTVNEAPGPANAFTPVTLDPSQSYRLTFTGIGSELTGRVFAMSDLSTPLATVHLTDSSYSSGLVGVADADTISRSTGLSSNSPLDVTFDNFRASAVPEPGALALFAAGAAAILGVRFRSRPGPART